MITTLKDIYDEQSHLLDPAVTPTEFAIFSLLDITHHEDQCR